jgi:multifunctional methyltransferase subunit TRM112
MRLVIHNMLKCNIKGVENGYPLKIESTQMEEIENEFDVEVVQKTLSKIDWNALRSAASDMGLSDLTEISELSPDVLADEDALRKIHHILFEVHLIEGALVCPESGRKFPVREGIPNMLLHEDEV